jgi:prevent-host-death family protein
LIKEEDVEQMGIFDAKVHLSKLVERASRGETIVITRNGRPMAKLMPAEAARAVRLTCNEALAALRDIRSRAKIGPDLTIRQLIEEGRRY